MERTNGIDRAAAFFFIEKTTTAVRVFFDRKAILKGIQNFRFQFFDRRVKKLGDVLDFFARHINCSGGAAAARAALLALEVKALVEKTGRIALWFHRDKQVDVPLSTKVDGTRIC